MAENPYSQFQRKAVENPYARFVAAKPAAPEQTATSPMSQLLMDDPNNPNMQSIDPRIAKEIGTNVMAGGKRTLTGMGQMLLPKSLEFGPFTDEARARDAEERKKLEGTAGETAGQMIGETIPTLPLGGPLAAAGKYLVAATRNAPAVSTLARTLASAPARAGVEGAVDAAAVNDTGNEVDAAVAGGGLGTILSLTGTIGRRAGSGVVRKSDEAADFEHLAGQHGETPFLPLAQAASDKDIISRLFKSGYRELLPLVPGTGGRLERQSRSALSTARKIAAGEATPDGMTVPKDVGENVGKYVRDLKDEFNKRFQNTVKSYAFNVPSNFRGEVESRIRAKLPNVDDTTLNKIAGMAEAEMTRFSSGKAVIDGENMLNVKNSIGRNWGVARGPEKPALEAAQDYIDEIIEMELRQGNAPQNLADLKEYQDLAVPYKNFVSLNRAAKSAKRDRGNFNMSQLARASRDPSELLDLAQTTRGATAGSVSGRTPRWVGGAALGGLTALDPTSAVLTIGAGQLLSTEIMQKALLGDTAAQKAVMEFLDNNPSLMKELGQVIRSTAATQTGANYGSAE